MRSKELCPDPPFPHRLHSKAKVQAVCGSKDRSQSRHHCGSRSRCTNRRSRHSIELREMVTSKVGG